MKTTRLARRSLATALTVTLLMGLSASVNAGDWKVTTTRFQADAVNFLQRRRPKDIHVARTDGKFVIWYDDYAAADRQPWSWKLKVFDSNQKMAAYLDENERRIDAQPDKMGIIIFHGPGGFGVFEGVKFSSS